MSKGFANFLSHRLTGLRSTCHKANILMGEVYPFWDTTRKRYIYNRVTKERFSDTPDISTLSKTIEAMKIHASTNGGFAFAMPKLAVDWMKRNGNKLQNYSVISSFMLTYRL